MTSLPRAGGLSPASSTSAVRPVRAVGSGRIAVSGIAARGHHGVFEHERTDGQDFVIDVVLEVDLEDAATSDDLAATVDYGGLAAAVVADIEGEPLNLIEALAARVAQTCLRFERVTTAEVTVHKPQAPMPVRFSDVAVTLVRTRSDGEADLHEMETSDEQS
ncbi:MAG TPA: dihydroneopterin aldolase [Microlunatus sp.]|nr:dihydroneopterin aldolase [Microlunatus sp.]